MRIAIIRSHRALLPEVVAYRTYFTAHGFHCDEYSSMREAISDRCDIAIVFYGMYPKWAARPRILVADVNSLSGGRLRRFRDVTKAVVNHKPDVRIALNAFVAKSSIGRPKLETLLRGMGYFPEFVVERQVPEFDVIYAGTLDRPGVQNAITRLYEMGLKVCVAGAIRPRHMPAGINWLGALSLEALYQTYARTRLGLNYIPNIMPYNRQDSTKLIEYCANGLGVVTTRYPWVNDFELSRGGQFLTWDPDLRIDQVLGFDYRCAYVSDLKWPDVIERSKILDTLTKLHYRATTNSD